MSFAKNRQHKNQLLGALITWH